MKKINLLLLILFLSVSCGGLKDAGKVLRNEKTATTDEFLIKKRNPLVLPPDFEKIPEPGSITKKDQEDENKIQKILKAPESSKSTNKRVKLNGSWVIMRTGQAPKKRSYSSLRIISVGITMATIQG